MPTTVTEPANGKVSYQFVAGETDVIGTYQAQWKVTDNTGGVRSFPTCPFSYEVESALPVPVIASGGAGNAQHMVDAVVAGGADAVLAASIFHFGEVAIGEVKQAMAGAGIPVRQTEVAA